eukprot:9455-Heterococcus_DN1.PRE.3
MHRNTAVVLIRALHCRSGTDWRHCCVRAAFVCYTDAAMTGGSGNSNSSNSLAAAAANAAHHSPRLTLAHHCAAVKAIAWSPHTRNLLASGGGTADRCIKTWNSATGAMLKSVDTDSQNHQALVLSTAAVSRSNYI